MANDGPNLLIKLFKHRGDTMDTLFAHSSLIHTPSYIKSPHLGWDWSQMLTLLTLALNWELSLILSEPSVICHVYHCLDNILNIKHEKHLRKIPCSIICFQVFKMKAHTDLLSKLCLDCNVLTVLVTSDLYLGCVKCLVFTRLWIWLCQAKMEYGAVRTQRLG